MHRHKNAVHPDESNPEVNLAQPLIHKPSKHLREPEVSCGEHAEDRRDSHYEMKVTRNDVRVVHREVQRALTKNQSADAAGNEQRNEAKRKQHRSRESDSASPECPDPIERL